MKSEKVAGIKWMTKALDGKYGNRPTSSSKLKTVDGDGVYKVRFRNL